jgi:hypothetical protein
MLPILIILGAGGVVAAIFQFVKASRFKDGIDPNDSPIKNNRLRNRSGRK